MIPEFEKLDRKEVNRLVNAIPLITVLIAGADGNIDMKEREWAKKVTNIRTFASNDILQGYYGLVNDKFEKKLDHFIKDLPDDVWDRNREISKKLEKLNPILEKLDQAYAHYLYRSFKSFAKHVANSSGGFLKFWAVSSEEKEWLDMPMLRPIELPEED